MSDKGLEIHAYTVKDNVIRCIGELLPRYQHLTTHMRGNTSV